jgi:hypothetical protein
VRSLDEGALAGDATEGEMYGSSQQSRMVEVKCDWQVYPWIGSAEVLAGADEELAFACPSGEDSVMEDGEAHQGEVPLRSAAH